MNTVEIKNLLKDGLKEINLSKYLFGAVRIALEELGYVLGTYSDNKYEELCDWTNGWELDYWADIFSKTDFNDYRYTGFTITGSFWYGTCEIAKYELYN